MELTPDEIKHLLEQPEVAKLLVSFNRIKSARNGTSLEQAVELIGRARKFEAFTRPRGNVAALGL